MNITSISPSFGAKLSGQTYLKMDLAKRETVEKETKFSEMVKSYDDQIAKIQQQKVRAIELDTFMRTDKTVQELVKKLPKEDTLEMVNNFCAYCHGDDSELEMEDLSLLYVSERLDNPSEMESFEVQNPKGEIDKKGIIDWLKDLLERVSE